MDIKEFAIYLKGIAERLEQGVEPDNTTLCVLMTACIGELTTRTIQKAEDRDAFDSELAESLEEAKGEGIDV